MTLKEALTKLKAFGNDKMRAHNTKNGAGANQFGVKMGDIRKVAAEIKNDHALALKLWDSGNIDAQLLACLVVKPKQLSLEQLEAIQRTVDFVGVADWFSSYVLKQHPQKESVRERWMDDENPWVARAGWSLTWERINKSPDGLNLSALLDRIEADMADAPAPTQWTMNFCLGSIGINNAKLRKRAIAIGEKLGLYRDYPVSKGCTSPFVPIWINEIVSRQQ